MAWPGAKLGRERGLKPHPRVVADPGYVPVGPDPHCSRRGNLAQHWQFPRALVGGVDELHSVGPFTEVQRFWPAKVDENRSCAVQQRQR
jgi:hypothetical protein